MSSTTTGGFARSPDQRSRAVQGFFYGAGCLVTAYLIQWAVANRDELSDAFPELFVWISVAAFADPKSVPCWQDVFLTMSLPVTLAAGMLLTPPLARMVASLGAFDSRELKREIAL